MKRLIAHRIVTHLRSIMFTLTPPQNLRSIPDRTAPLHNSPLPNWDSRYQPNLNALLVPNQEFPIHQLLDRLSSAGRKRTVDLVRRHLKINCELAGLDAHRLFSTSKNVVSLSKVRSLSVYVERIYDRLLTCYLEQAQQAPAITGRSVQQVPIASIPTLSTLSQALNPLLEDLYKAHLVGDDPRTIGFVTTQFHFTTRAIFKRLKLWDQVLLYPYLQFAEEQVCMPWHDLNQAALSHPAHSPEVMLVNQMIGECDQIAIAVYQQAQQQLPSMKSTRGDMTHPDVAASIIRDTTMFQTYLWLCVLEGNVSAVQDRLLPLCIMVFPSVGVSWEWVYQMLVMMVSQISENLSAEQWDLVRPTAELLLETFMLEDDLSHNLSSQQTETAQITNALPEQTKLEEQAAYRVFQPIAIEDMLPSQPFAPHLWSAFKS